MLDCNLADDWQVLERQADIDFFLCWDYIQHVIQTFWLDTESFHSLRDAGSSLMSCRCYVDDKLSAICLLTVSTGQTVDQKQQIVDQKNQTVKTRAIDAHAIDVLLGKSASNQHPSEFQSSVKRICLNETGDARRDQIYIEYNQLVGERDLCARHIYPLLPGAFRQAFPNLKQSDFSGVVNELWQALALSVSPLRLHKRYQSPCFRLRLDPKQAGLSYLSRNRRSKIRQSINYLGGEEHVKLIPLITSREQALAFETIGTLHKQRWGEASGFYNAEFRRFFETLLARASVTNAVNVGSVEVHSSTKAETDANVGHLNTKKFGVHLFALQTAELAEGGGDGDGETAMRTGADSLALAQNFLLLFSYDETCYFYLSALSQGEDSKHRTGWVAHVLAIEWAARQGFRYYDFMGGDADYKRSFTQSEYGDTSTITHCTVYSGLSFGFVKNIGRHLRDRLVDRYRKLSFKQQPDAKS